MRIFRALLRVGICIVIIGASIFFANLSSTRGSTSYIGFEVPANGTDMTVTDLNNRPYEFRILVPNDFNGTFYIFNYEGIKQLAEGKKTPILEKTLNGPQLIDFTIGRRGAYMLMIESKISTDASGSINYIEKAGVSQDILLDSTIIILSGSAIVVMTLVPIIKKRPGNHFFI